MKNIFSYKIASLLFVALISINLTSCVNSKEKNDAMSMHHMDHGEDMMHMHHDSPDIELPDDIPVFLTSQKTYSNAINFLKATNSYVRYNAKPEYKAEITEFYNTALIENGWEIDTEKSEEDKWVIHKDKRHATIRSSTMKLGDSLTVAITVNLVEPKVSL